MVSIGYLAILKDNNGFLGQKLLRIKKNCRFARNSNNLKQSTA